MGIAAPPGNGLNAVTTGATRSGGVACARGGGMHAPVET
jgi:hypothetical protein